MMDRSWIGLSRVDRRYYKGIEDFIEFVRQRNVPTHPCPCNVCKGMGRWIDLDEMRKHLIKDGIMPSYTTWTMHGEVGGAHVDDIQSSGTHSQIHEDWNNTCFGGPTMELLNDAFPFIRDQYDGDDDNENKVEYEKYCKLLEEAQRPIYDGSDTSVLECILEALELKVKSRWSDKSFDGHLQACKKLLTKAVPVNDHPESYSEMKKVLNNLGLGYQTFHGCEKGCVLYYKEYEHLESCPICDEPRYHYKENKRKAPKKVIRYFPITPRLKRLYSSPRISKEMRWHGERRVSDGDDDLRHPADGDEWKNFNIQFPEFANEIRNVRLGLATDGFNPFGIVSTRHSTWPIVLIPYNLPPSMCMKKEFNILAILVSGPKSPGKCLNVFMRPLIDELQILWNEGVLTYDRDLDMSFTMRAAVLWTISDFPGLGMLGGIKTSGYKACPICLNGIDAIHSDNRMSYLGHRRWLPRDHHWRRAADKFGGTTELREKPHFLSGVEILDAIRQNNYPVLSLHSQFKPKRSSEKLCWTHESIFYELPYWQYLIQPYSLDVMHIEKNVFDCVVGSILSFEGKRHIWDTPGSSSSKGPDFVVEKENKVRILELLEDVKYPSGYAGTLTSKIQFTDKKFCGLKTHDCHVMFERLIPVFIRPFLPTHVANPIICLCRWFQRLCCRELSRRDIIQMKEDIVLILCHFERIFPVGFFTIMVHLMVHLPDQVLLKGPVHYNWMYPIERQLGEYKKYVRNTRYPEGCIAEQYIARECVMYIKLYTEYNVSDQVMMEQSTISVVSQQVNPYKKIAKVKLTKQELDMAHYCVLENCEEAKYFVTIHKIKFEEEFPNRSENDRIKHFIPYFHNWIGSLEGCDDYNEQLYYLSCGPQSHSFYSHCEVNGVKFVTWERDCNLRTQNSGVMVETEDEKYYGALEDVIELIYPHGVSVVVFKCRWFNEGKWSIKKDHGIESLDTSITWYENTPYCLALAARQVFYIDDPKCGGNWKVINNVEQRGIYKDGSLARDERNILATTDDLAYQEDLPNNIPNLQIETFLHSSVAQPTTSYQDSEDNNELDSEEEDEMKFYDDEDDDCI